MTIADEALREYGAARMGQQLRLAVNGEAPHAQAPLGIDPAPGLYPCRSYDEYAAVKAVNASAIVAGRHTAAELRVAIDEPDRETTEALEVGIAFHVAVFEPERMAERVGLGPINPSTKKCYGIGTVAWRAAKNTTPGVALIGMDDYDAVRYMADAVLSHPMAGPIVRAAGHRECVEVWDDKETGIRCKSRHDLIVPGHLLIDGKSSLNIHGFDDDACRYDYHIRGAFYMDGHEARTGDALPYYMIVAQKCKPWLVKVVPLERDSDAYAVGRFEYQKTLRVLREARRSGEWPGFTGDVYPIQLRPWLRKQYEEMGVLEERQ